MPKFKLDNYADDEDYTPDSQSDLFDSFFQNGLVAEILYEVKSGKEATLYCCRAGTALQLPTELVAVKQYRSQNQRNFKNDSQYREGNRTVLGGRNIRAFDKKTSFGRQVQAGTWLAHEYETLERIYKAGSEVPNVYALADNSILMEFIGDENGAANLLHNTMLEDSAAPALFQQTLRNVEIWLGLNLVHGDLSAYNILYWQGKLVFIDFPQAVDPRFSPYAENLLRRDLQNVCRYFQQYGIRADSDDIATRLWQRFRNAQI